VDKAKLIILQRHFGGSVPIDTARQELFCSEPSVGIGSLRVVRFTLGDH
jgi:hypothetical protein